MVHGLQQTQRWLKAGVFEAMVHDLRALLRLAAGRTEQPTGAIFDSHTLQSSPESGSRAGYDGAKRRKGSKTAAVRQYLHDRVLPVLTDPQLRFETLVAAHVLAVVEREIEVGDDPLVEEWITLSGLLHDQPIPVPAESADLQHRLGQMRLRLSTQIRRGERDLDPEVLACLRQFAGARLDVSNPRFER